jgi:hypothetical protein
VLCAKDKDDVTVLQVVPGTWTGFNNFVGICTDCQATDAYKKLLKQKKILTRPAPEQG